jgi:uncharacterized protein YbaA (DUF1428 family)
MAYIDGFVTAVPTVNREQYKAHVEYSAAVFKEHGATRVADQFYGDRAGRVRDPFGHHWIIATRIREVSEAEMVAAFHAMFD